MDDSPKKKKRNECMFYFDERLRRDVNHDKRSQSIFQVFRGAMSLRRQRDPSTTQTLVVEDLPLQHTIRRVGSRSMSADRKHWGRRPSLKIPKENAPKINEVYYVQAEIRLKKALTWDFNIFHYDVLLGGRSLSFMSAHIFEKYGFIQRFQLDSIAVQQFLFSLEDSYIDTNPYHNARHAADVTQAMFCFLQEEKLRNCVTDLEAMIAIIAAMGHDCNHPGVNQAFLENTSSYLVDLSKISVLEDHHWRIVLALMKKSGIFSHFSKEEWQSVILILRSLILATDIKQQPIFLKKFTQKINKGKLNTLSDPKTRLFVLQMALKSADICNPCRPEAICVQWSEAVCKEFFTQGDREKELKIPVSPLCDRHTNTIASIQSGFIAFVVQALILQLDRFFKSRLSRAMREHLQKNKQHWKEICDKNPTQKTSRLSLSSFCGHQDSVWSVLKATADRYLPRIYLARKDFDDIS